MARRNSFAAPAMGSEAISSEASIWDGTNQSARQVRPDELSHAEQDRHGHFASKIRDQNRKAQARARWSWHVQRGADLAKVIAHRIAPETTIPQTDDAEVLILCMARHLRAQCGDDDFWMPLYEWCDQMAPWVKQGAADILAPIIRAVSPNARDFTAKKLGNMLHVTWEERCLLGLRTIRPWGMTDTEFEQLRLERKRIIDRHGAEQRRREAGQKRWADHAWQNRIKPWVLIGFGRRTWEKAYRDRELSALIARGRIAAPEWLVGLASELDAGLAFSDCAFSSRIPVGAVTDDENAQSVPLASRKARRSPVGKKTRPSSLLAEAPNGSTVAASGHGAATARQEDTAPDGTLHSLRNFGSTTQAREKPRGSHLAA